LKKVIKRCREFGKGMQCELLLNRKEMKDLRKIFPKSPANISTDTRNLLFFKIKKLFGLL